ncbi:MAG: CDP-diacylglycerol--glycerol-3-phosphate 3-phosphatidyltransferase [Oscillospiraceae bacterium]|jgi:CDP-diacylglycerol--glycerol-3-phosphate 3-phosphatidyltransferase|nr:CDP-diacylglycerol--glycerol-3-phosphate 3-phosphatidyltransferase [Oscillospiraceae bacterium]
MNIPNKLTISRMLMVPVFLAVILMDVPHRFLFAIITFAVAAITDALDGKIARKTNQITVFGKLADPVADKMMTTAALLAFMQLGLCDIWIVLIVLTREFAVTSIRLVASAQGTVIPANIWGKLKTVSQMTFTLLIMLIMELDYLKILPDTAPLALISNILLAITALLTVISGVIYVVESSKIIDFSK